MADAALSTPRVLTPPLVHPLPYTVLAFDADGTLRGCTVPGRPPNTPAEATILPGVLEVLQHYAWQQTHGFGLASNQGGVGLGFMSEATCLAMLSSLATAVTGCAWPPAVLQVCPHAPQAGCPCRKPQPTMLTVIEMFYYSHAVLHGPGGLLYVGDQDSDREAALAAGVDFAWAQDFFGWEGGAHA